MSHPTPWRYVSGFHKKESPPCAECRRSGWVDIEDANGESVIGAWAEYAGDAGLSMDEETAMRIINAVNAGGAK